MKENEGSPRVFYHTQPFFAASSSSADIAPPIIALYKGRENCRALLHCRYTCRRHVRGDELCDTKNRGLIRILSQ